jgi:drug/metabolite transporter (DMT)-like permease
MPVVVVALAASAWGVFWIPLRRIGAEGLGPGWTTFAQFAAAVVVLLPAVVWRAVRSRSTGVSQAVSGMLLGGAFALYAYSLLLTAVARALILFYVTPVWSTVLEVVVWRRRFTGGRAAALALGLSGLLVMLVNKAGAPFPGNVGDTMAIVAGIMWAFGTMKVRVDSDVGILQHVFSFFLYGGAFALCLAVIPLGTTNVQLSWERLVPMAPWLVLLALVFLVPVMCALIWGSQRIDPGRLGIILQLEAVVGIVSAALLTNEPFGIAEIIGTVMVVGAGSIDVLCNRA